LAHKKQAEQPAAKLCRRHRAVEKSSVQTAQQASSIAGRKKTLLEASRSYQQKLFPGVSLDQEPQINSVPRRYKRVGQVNYRCTDLFIHAANLPQSGRFKKVMRNELEYLPQTISGRINRCRI